MIWAWSRVGATIRKANNGKSILNLFIDNRFVGLTDLNRFYCETRCKNTKSSWIQLLPRHIVAFSVLDDDDMPVFNYFLDGRFGFSGITIVFVDTMVGLHDGVGSDDFGFNAVVVNLAYAKTVFPCTGVVPGGVSERCFCQSVG